MKYLTTLEVAHQLGVSKQTLLNWLYADKIPEPPSTYYFKNITGCFFDDHHGLASLDAVGVDNITFETDYPHSDSTWPHTLEVAKKLMGHLDAETQYKIVRGNAIRLFELDFDK